MLALLVASVLAAVAAPAQAGGLSGGGGSPTPRANADGWAGFPWAEDTTGKGCPAPSAASKDAGTRVVVMGDSLIRNSRSSLKSALQRRGYSPVFVCWGGRTVQWGIDQLRIMRARGVLPSCLVVNLGVNDLYSPITPSILQHRLEALLRSTSGIDHVLLVNLWVDTSAAPSTMRIVARTAASYRNAVATTGRGTVVNWALQARTHPWYTDSEGIHDTDDGISARTRTIVSAVTRTCGAPALS